jgi:hypothetical protein
VVIENMGLQEPEVHEQIAWRLIQHYSAPRHGGGVSQGSGGAAASGSARRRGGGRLPGRGSLPGRRGRGRRGAGGSSSSGGTSAAAAAAEPGGHRPAVILFNTAQLADPGWDCYYSLVPDCCAGFAPRVGPDYRTGRSDAAHNTLADYYGFASISHKCVERGWLGGRAEVDTVQRARGLARPALMPHLTPHLTPPSFVPPAPTPLR